MKKLEISKEWCEAAAQREGDSEVGVGALADCAQAILELRNVNTELLDALSKLSNEVLASLPIMEPLARREFGNTNYNVLIQRAEEARALVSSLKRES